MHGFSLLFRLLVLSIQLHPTAVRSPTAAYKYAAPGFGIILSLDTFSALITYTGPLLRVV